VSAVFLKPFKAFYEKEIWNSKLFKDLHVPYGHWTHQSSLKSNYSNGNKINDALNVLLDRQDSVCITLNVAVRRSDSAVWEVSTMI